jgi:two-component system, OmpR family, sensor histidine kinase CiaH
MLVNAAVMLAVVAALGVTVMVVLDHLLIAQETAAVESEADQARVDAHELSENEFIARHSSYASGTFYVLWDTGGHAIFNPSGVPASPLRAAATAALAGRAGTSTISLGGNRYALVDSERTTQSGQPASVIQAGRSLAPVRAVEAEALLVLLAAAGLALIMIGLASWFLAERALVPIRQALERQRNFTADASHELRTPLSVLNAGIQLLRRHPDQTIAQNERLLGSMAGQADRMSRLVAGLLALARADSGETEVQVVQTDLDALLEAALHDLEPLIQQHGSRVCLQQSQVGTAPVDPDRFKQLLVILVDNALRHTPSGTEVEVICRRRDNELVLEVADHGPGIPARERQQVFERFHRPSGSQKHPGSGLGLAIARWIVDAHGGSITLDDNHPGVRARATFPAVNSARHHHWRARRPSPAAEVPER